jgi:hypothetical protein
MLIAAKAMSAALKHIKPFFTSGEVKRKGVFVIGTVKLPKSWIPKGEYNPKQPHYSEYEDSYGDPEYNRMISDIYDACFDHLMSEGNPDGVGEWSDGVPDNEDGSHDFEAANVLGDFIYT